MDAHEFCGVCEVPHNEQDCWKSTTNISVDKWKRKYVIPKSHPDARGERVKESVRTLKGQYSKKYDNWYCF